MKNNIKAWLIGICGLVAGFFIGWFIRQPKINKLRKEKEVLINNNQRLGEFSEKVIRKYDDLKNRYNESGILNLKLKKKLKEELKYNLFIQYCLYEFNRCIDERLNSGAELTKDELVFLNRMKKILKKEDYLTNEDSFIKVQSYVFNKYGNKINKLEFVN